MKNISWHDVIFSGKFQGYQNAAALAFSQLTDIPSFIPHFQFKIFEDIKFLP
jgi:hypothetical protein